MLGSLPYFFSLLNIFHYTGADNLFAVLSFGYHFHIFEWNKRKFKTISTALQKITFLHYTFAPECHLYDNEWSPLNAMQIYRIFFTFPFILNIFQYRVDSALASLTAAGLITYFFQKMKTLIAWDQKYYKWWRLWIILYTDANFSLDSMRMYRRFFSIHFNTLCDLNKSFYLKHR